MMLSYKEFQENLNEALITFGGKAYPKFGQILAVAGGAGCFQADTLVKTKVGLKKISDITENDFVESFNESTGEYEYKQVLELVEYHNVKPLVKVTTDEGDFVCTADHEFLIDGKWTKAKDLI